MDEVTERIVAALAERGIVPPAADRTGQRGRIGPAQLRVRPNIYKSPDEMRRMLRPGLATAASLAAARAAIAPGCHDAGTRPARRSGDPLARRCAQLHEGTRLPAHDLRVDQRGHRARHPGGAGRWPPATSSRSTAAPRSAAGTATRRSPSCCPTRTARTGSPSCRELSDVTEQSLWCGIAALASASHLGEVGGAIEDYIDRRGNYGILEDYTGHGIGRSMHEEPPVFNYRVRDRGPRVRPGLVVAIEPMVTLGGIETFVRRTAGPSPPRTAPPPRTGSTPSPCTTTASGCSPPRTAVRRAWPPSV